MFGFQRTGDSIWAAANQMARGFLLGATAGRTTLTGEGLQHNDGHSLLLAATNPVSSDFHSLGTDGFGLSDTRPAARRHFTVDAESITVQALAALVDRGELDRQTLISAAAKYRIDDPRAAGPQTSDPGSA